MSQEQTGSAAAERSEPASRLGVVTWWTWARNTPLRRYLRTETSSAAILLAATMAALGWANADPAGYESFRSTVISISIGDHILSADVAEWVNSGLMTFFFFVVGLEARRELDLGELRERRRVGVPLLASLGAMAGAVGLYLLVNRGQPSAAGWGVAMSTDTAFALALLALAGPLFRERLRGFVLTVVIVDDIVALIVIAVFYTAVVQPGPLAVAVALYLLIVIGVRLHIRLSLVYLLLAVAAWLALRGSGIDPLILGLALGLLPYASTGDSSELERVSALFRRFREEPTPELARTTSTSLNWSVSPNNRLAALFHPWTSYLIAPLFALVNAGIIINPDVLSRAAGSPITIGIVLGYVVGKPLGLTAMSWLVTAVSRGRLRPPVGWAATLGAGTSTGVGFTVSLLITSIAFDGTDRQDATLGILVAAAVSAGTTLLVFRAADSLPEPRRSRALVGVLDPVVDLLDPPDPDCDHVRGPVDAPVTLVEYGDFECPHCGRAEPAVRELLLDRADVRYIWRHLPLTDVHPHARMAAEAAEAAAQQNAFWQLHDIMLEHQSELTAKDLLRYAERIGVDADRFRRDLADHTGAGRIDRDIEQAAASGVVGTPTFFVNGQRLVGSYDLATLTTAVNTALARAAAATTPAPRPRLRGRRVGRR